MNDRAERRRQLRRHRLATGIFHQPTLESQIDDAKHRIQIGIDKCDERMYEKAEAELEKLCHPPDPGLAGASDVVPKVSQYCCPACLQVGVQMRSDSDVRCTNPECDVKTFRKAERLAVKK